MLENGVKPNVTSYKDAMFRCMAEEAGLIDIKSTGRLVKTVLIKRIKDSQHSAEKERFLLNLLPECLYWDQCRKKFCA